MAQAQAFGLQAFDYPSGRDCSSCSWWGLVSKSLQSQHPEATIGSSIDQEIRRVKIGELGKQADCQVETIRYYEREGLLPVPGRSEGNYRVYGREHLERLVFIRNCRTLDMTLDEIRRLLLLIDRPEESCDSVNGLVDEHIRHVELRINSLLALQKQLVELRHRCAAERGVDECAIIQQLSSSGGVQPLPEAEHTHVGKSHRH